MSATAEKHRQAGRIRFLAAAAALLFLAGLTDITIDDAAAQASRVNKQNRNAAQEERKSGVLGDLTFGAIAISQAEEIHRASPAAGTQEEAEAGALDACRDAGGSECEVGVWYRNACGALAVGEGWGWGADYGVDRPSAEENAVTMCEGYTTQCRVVQVECAGSAG